MSEPIDSLIKALNSSGPNSAGVQQIVQQISTQSPAQVDLARTIVGAWPTTPTAAPPATSTDSGFGFLSPKFYVPLLAALGLGTAGGSSLDLSSAWKFVQTLPLPTITNRWELMGIVAGIGAIVGFFYSLYRNNWAVVLPTFQNNQGLFKVASLGCLRNIFMGAVVAVFTTWSAHASTTAPPVNGSFLTWTVIGSAVAAGIVGSRMASGEVEKQVLWDALSNSASQPAVVGLSALVKNASTALDAAAIATGQPVPGVKPPEDITAVRQPAVIEANLLANFDKTALNDWLKNRGIALGKDGAGLPLGVLAAAQGLKPIIKAAIKDLDLPTCAAMSTDGFLAEVDKKGIDAANFKDLLALIQDQAISVMKGLNDLPVGWSLTAERALTI